MPYTIMFTHLDRAHKPWVSRLYSGWAISRENLFSDYILQTVGANITIEVKGGLYYHLTFDTEADAVAFMLLLS